MLAKMMLAEVAAVHKEQRLEYGRNNRDRRTEEDRLKTNERERAKRANRTPEEREIYLAKGMAYRIRTRKITSQKRADEIAKMTPKELVELRAKEKAKRQKNKDSTSESQKAYRKKNAAAIKAYKKKWCKENPDKVKAYMATAAVRAKTKRELARAERDKHQQALL